MERILRFRPKRTPFPLAERLPPMARPILKDRSGRAIRPVLRTRRLPRPTTTAAAIAIQARRRPHRPGCCPRSVWLRCCHGKHRNAIGNSLEAPDTAGHESKARSAARYIAYRRGDEHLTGSSLSAHPRREVDRAAHERLASLNRLAGVDPNTDPERRIGMLYGVASCRVDDGEAAGHSIARRGKDHVERVAFCPDLCAGVTCHLVAHENAVGVQQIGGGSVAMGLAEGGVPAKVGEEESAVGARDAPILSHARSLTPPRRAESPAGGLRVDSTDGRRASPRGTVRCPGCQ